MWPSCDMEGGLKEVILSPGRKSFSAGASLPFPSGVDLCCCKLFLERLFCFPCQVNSFFLLLFLSEKWREKYGTWTWHWILAALGNKCIHPVLKSVFTHSRVCTRGVGWLALHYQPIGRREALGGWPLSISRPLLSLEWLLCRYRYSLSDDGVMSR